MTYILVIWTLVGFATPHASPAVEKYDWRSLGEFRTSLSDEPAKQMCENAARELNIKSDRYRCVRSK